jgi:NAD(P)-dependent dehydrogenase (short-subunit alcohol dehydrogenase family)
MDVSNEDEAADMAAAAIATFGGIDILINNAGIHVHHARAPYTREGLAQWRRIMDVNVIGALNCTIACRDSMRERPGAAIVNQSSMAAYGGGGAYSVSKLALQSLTVALAGELGPEDIRVNAIAPGLVDSEAAIDSMGEDGINMVVQGQVIKRLGRMDDLASTVLFLCSDEASFITGQTFVVDGGHTRKPY